MRSCITPCGRRRPRPGPSMLMLLGLALPACRDSEETISAPPETPAFAVSEAARATGPREFIVTLRSATADPVAVARDHGVEARLVYSHAVNGFAGRMSDLARSGLLRDARVKRVVANGRVSVSEVQGSAPWGLDRLDQRRLPLNGAYTFEQTGSAVTAYVIDTGIRPDHQEFGVPSRVSRGFDAYPDIVLGDCHGHGTHVAGIVGGAVYGVAKDVQLVAVRVLDCAGSGSEADVIAGLDWVLANAQRPAVVNMSLGGPPMAVLDDAVARVISSGITVVAAAGNSSGDACYPSPARVPSAITVAASDASDARAYFSNFGPCVDWFAPGVDIMSANPRDGISTISRSGTSMAAPHVAGAAALVLQGEPTASPARVRQLLWERLTADVVLNAGVGTPRHLLSVLRPSGPAPKPPASTDQVVAQAKAYKNGGVWQVVVEAAAVRTTQAKVYKNGVLLATISYGGLGWRYVDNDITTKGKLPPIKYVVCDSDDTRCSVPATPTTR